MNGAKRIIALLFFSLVIFWIFESPLFAADNEGFASKIASEALKKLDRAVNYLEKKLETEGKNEKKSLVQSVKELVFKTYDEKLDAIINDLLAILINSRASEYRKEVIKIEEEVKNLRVKVADYETKALLAPSSKRWYEFYKKTKQDYRRKVEKLQREIEDKEKAVEEIERKLINELRKMGLNLSEEQMRSLLKSVMADDIVQMVSLINNVKFLEAQLGRLMQRRGEENLVIAKKYYGIHVLLLRLVITLYEREVRKVESVYLPKLEEIEKTASMLIEEAKAELEGARSAENAALLKQNIRSNELTLKVVRLYKEYLRSQKMVFEKRLEALREDYLVAENTFRTVRTSGRLMELIRSGKERFEALLSIEIPEIPVFYNEAMKKEFERLTSALK
ncbi:MAG: hypothetical protein J7M13_04500 [Synergistetes bacterium]|nr:hypothetical protein [Synergistota bacterium]